MTKKIYIAAAAFILALQLILVIPVRAASIYDLTINPMPRLMLGVDGSSGPNAVQDITNTLQTKIAIECGAGYLAEYITAINTGQVAIYNIIPEFPEDGPLMYAAVVVYRTTNSPANIEFSNSTPDALTANIRSTSNLEWTMLYFPQTYSEDQCEVTTVNSSSSTGPTIATYWPNRPWYSIRPFVTKGFTVNYPPAYEGVPLPDQFPPEDNQRTPEFEWYVTKEGNLRVSYLRNISPFLTGNFRWDIYETDDEWGSLNNIHSEYYSPAGWFEEWFELPGEGYYSFSMTHNQQLDSPPWAEKPHINMVTFEIYWDGKSFVNGTNVGGCAGGLICNDFLDPENENTKLFGWLNINIYGIQEFFLIPINFISTLPDYIGNCEPISLPIFGGQNATLPCLSSTYYNQGFFSPIWVIWQTIVTGVTAWYVAFSVFRVIKNVNTPHNDGIEVVKL